ncbi:DDRGK domain-containing protein 1-like [Saccostrea cucullata]|uniref:DDRGK domain-containing protein 1-like n=1 Tax=Saccostrea cuccullata TaxID=36930 RepID=UPI002ED4FDFB
MEKEKEIHVKKYDDIFEELQKKVNLREQELNEQYERFEEQKQKVKALEEQQRAEREERLRSKMKEMDKKREEEREIVKREKELNQMRSKPENLRQDYKLLCQKLKERFDRKDHSHIIRRQLEEVKQNPGETKKGFAERIGELAT